MSERIKKQMKKGKNLRDGNAYDKEVVLELLNPFFKNGLSVYSACKLIGFDASTVYKWLQADDELSMKVKTLQNAVTLKALEHKVKAVKNGEKADVDWWLSRNRRIKDEFTERTEVTGADGASLPTPILQIDREGESNESNLDKQDI